MVTRDATRLVQAVVKGLRRAGMRGLIARGWADLPAQGHDDLLVIDGAPHAQLFPRCRLIVHHGGAGTTAAALTTGKPSLIIPFMVDQPWWAERLREAGLGPAALKPARLTAGRFARALKRLEKDVGMARRCAETGRRLQAETGTARAADLIEADALRWIARSEAGTERK